MSTIIITTLTTVIIIRDLYTLCTVMVLLARLFMDTTGLQIHLSMDPTVLQFIPHSTININQIMVTFILIEMNPLHIMMNTTMTMIMVPPIMTMVPITIMFTRVVSMGSKGLLITLVLIDQTDQICTLVDMATPVPLHFLLITLGQTVEAKLFDFPKTERREKSRSKNQ